MRTQGLLPALLAAIFVTAAGCGALGIRDHMELFGSGPVEVIVDGGGSTRPPDAGADAGVVEPNAFFTLLDALESTPTAQRQGQVDAFVQQHAQAIPYVIGTEASFLYLGEAGAVQLAGDHTCWARAPQPMARVPGTNLWHVSYTLPADARVDYKLIVDGSWILDPLNPRQLPSGFGVNSELAMPQWQHPDEIDARASVPKGTLVDHPQFYSTHLGNRRDVRVYLPPGYPAAAPYPSLYVHDGQEYLALASMQNVLDNLIAEGAISPLVVVFVPPVDRGAEYVGAKVPAFTRFVTEELVPFIDGQYATSTDPLRRGMMGTSNGGYVTLKIGLSAPHLFRRLGSQSGALRADGSALTDGWGAAAPDGQRIYLSTGTICDFITANDSFRERLQSRGYVHAYDVFNEGHSWGLWRGHLDSLLTFLWPAP